MASMSDIHIHQNVFPITFIENVIYINIQKSQVMAMVYISNTRQLSQKNSHSRQIFSTMPPPLRIAQFSESTAGGTPQRKGTATVIESFSFNPPEVHFSAITTCYSVFNFYTRVGLDLYTCKETSQISEKFIFFPKIPNLHFKFFAKSFPPPPQKKLLHLPRQRQ